MVHHSFYIAHEYRDAKGFSIWFDEFKTTVETTDGERMLKRSDDCTVAITLDPSVHHETLQDARCAAIEELHRRIGVIREQISQLRIDYLNDAEAE